MAALLRDYDIGNLLAFSPILAGVSNSNWLIKTTGGVSGDQFILTIFERRIAEPDLPFFLALLDHLAAKNCPVPRTIHMNNGQFLKELKGKPVALIECLPGETIAYPTPALARAAGRSLAGIHLAAADFPLRREQLLGLAAWRTMIEDTGAAELARMQPSLPDLLQRELDWLARNWPRDLPQGIAHCDVFPDNVLAIGDTLTGLIDFYFAAHDFLAYDLAVAHAAWCFTDEGERFRPAISHALISGYEEVRQLLPAERAALPVLARGAAMRFIASRAYDWVHTPPSATVPRKDPLEFVHRLRFYQAHGGHIFTTTAGSGKTAS